MLSNSGKGSSSVHHTETNIRSKTMAMIPKASKYRSENRGWDKTKNSRRANQNRSRDNNHQRQNQEDGGDWVIPVLVVLGLALLFG
jgi:hypothetical protein